MTCASRITGTGSSFPSHTISNSQIAAVLNEKGMEITDEWIREKTGVLERRFSNLNNSDEHNSSLGMKAAMKALEMAERLPEEIDQIIYATSSPDTQIPSTGCWLQHKIGAVNAWAMDISASCSGFIYGLSIADQFIRTDTVKCALVVGGEVLNPSINWEDRSGAILFGDGAGAAVVESVSPHSSHRILSSHLFSDGHRWKLFHIPAGGTSMELTPERYRKNQHKIQMNEGDIFKIAVEKLADYAMIALNSNDLKIGEVNWFIFNQSNSQLIDAVGEKLEIPPEKILINIDRYGNTSAASIPTVLDAALRKGRIRSGDLILMDAFGAGLTFGSLLLRW